MNKFLVPRRAIHFCPFCGLIADVTTRGEYCACPHCNVQFCIITNQQMAQSIGEKRAAKMCASKVSHGSLRSAWQAWLAIREKPARREHPMTIYLCELCGGFHLGHSSPSPSYKAKLVWTMCEAEEEVERLNIDLAAFLTRAGRYLMDQRDIWYDRVPNEKGDMVRGPHYQAVATLFILASDLRLAAKA